MLRRLALFPLFPALTIALALAACSPEPPQVLTDYRFHQRGTVAICFSEEKSTIADVTAMADDICRQYDRVAKLVLQQPYQCSWTAPTEAYFACIPRPGESPPKIVPHLAPMRHDSALPPQ
jgi:hypothetical protein